MTGKDMFVASCQAAGLVKTQALPDIATLIDDHDALDAMADRLIAVARALATGAQACRALTDVMDELLERHLGEEALFLHDARPDSEFARVIADFEAGFGDLHENWLLYRTQWDVPAIAADHRGFASATADMMTALKLRIARENEVLYPLALELGRIGAG